MKKLFVEWKELMSRVLGGDTISPSAQRIIVIAILLCCTAVRLWTIGAPALDRTAWKEIDYITVSSNYWQNGYNFFHPEISWPAEPPRITAMEFPLVPYAAALLYPFLGFNAFSVRIITLLAFLLMSIYVFRLAKRELGPIVGVLACLASAMMPLYHPFGRFLFSDPLMIAFSVMAIFHFARWVDERRQRDWWIAALGLSLAVALKLEPLFVLLPLVWLVFRKHGFTIPSYKGFVALVLTSLILPVLWYFYSYTLARDYLDVYGIFGGANGGHNKFQTFSMLTDFTWYRTMFGRVRWNILAGHLGSFLCLIGFISVILLRRGGLFMVYLVSVLVYFGIIAEGQIDAPYRQLNCIPPLSVFAGAGAASIMAAGLSFVARRAKMNSAEIKKSITWCLTGGIVLMLLAGVQQRRVVSECDLSKPVHAEKWDFAQELKKWTNPDGKLVVTGEYTIHLGGNDLSPVLYHYSGLQGWTLQKGQWTAEYVNDLRAKGATHFAAVEVSREPEIRSFLQALKKDYRLLYEDRDYLLIDLRQRRN